MPATVNIVFFKPRVYKSYSVIGPKRGSENLTSSGTSQQGNIVAEEGDVCMITSVGSNIYVNVGESPVAEPGDVLILDKVPTYIYLSKGSKLAVIDA